MKTPYTLALFMCALLSAHGQFVFSRSSPPEPIRHELLVHQLERSFEDDAATADERRAFLVLHSALGNNEDFWRNSTYHGTHQLITKDPNAEIPYSFKPFENLNVTVQIRSEAAVYGISNTDKIVLTGLPYGAAGLAFKRRF